MRRVVISTENDYDAQLGNSAAGGDDLADDTTSASGAFNGGDGAAPSAPSTASMPADVHFAASVHDLDEQSRNRLFRATFRLLASEHMLAKHEASLWSPPLKKYTPGHVFISQGFLSFISGGTICFDAFMALWLY